MKILLANFTKMINDSGGTAKVNCAFANEMVRRGNEVAMVYSDDREGEFFFPVDNAVRCWNLRRYNGKVQKLPFSYRLRRELVRGFSKKLAATINEDFTAKYLTQNAAAILEEFKPEVIICFQPAAAKVYLCDLKTKIPVILMAHGDTEDWFHYYPEEQIPAIRDSRVVQVLVPSFVQPVTSRLPNTKTVVIGNVVPQFEPIDLATKGGPHKILFIARLAKNHKRPHLLIEAFCRIADRFPDWSVEIWGAEDTRGYKKEMQATIDKAGLTSRIKLMGTTKEVEKVLSEGDLFVFPSAAEGFSLAVTEAMSKGLPAVVCRNCSALNEIVEDGKTGFLAAADPADIAEKMVIIMSDTAKRAEMGRNAHEAVKQYAADIIWGKWIKLLAEVTG